MRKIVEWVLLGSAVGVAAFMGCDGPVNTGTTGDPETTSSSSSTTVAQGSTSSSSVGSTSGTGMTGPCAGLPPDGMCDLQAEDCTCPDCSSTSFCVRDQCVTDGTCTLDDACTCEDCDNDMLTGCGCNFDGSCNSFAEWCQCPDCWDHEYCVDNDKVKCTDNGTCDLYDFCSCADCTAEAFCTDAANCTDDGSCDYVEGCNCADCAAEPGCQGQGGAGGAGGAGVGGAGGAGGVAPAGVGGAGVGGA